MSEAFTRPTRSLTGKVAIVTGAGAAGTGIGNGRAAAILLAEAGASLICVDLHLALAETTVSMIQSDPSPTASRQAFAIEANVAVEADCQRIVARAVAEYGRLDILVNGVGIGGASGTAVEVDLEEWARGMQVNVASMVMMCKYAVPEMRRNSVGMGTGDGVVQWRGSVVNVASVAGIRGGNPHLLYPTSKGAVVVSCLFFSVLDFCYRSCCGGGGDWGCGGCDGMGWYWRVQFLSLFLSFSADLEPNTEHDASHGNPSRRRRNPS